MINHTDKSYVQLPMPIDLMKVLPPEVQAMAPMMQMTATVTPDRRDEDHRRLGLQRLRRDADGDGHADEDAHLGVDGRAGDARCVRPRS